MTIELSLIILTITFFSAIQSLFGMGLLLFGTPTLILLGYDYMSSISYLLPSSLVISLLQVFSRNTTKVKISKYLSLLCVPALVLGLCLIKLELIESLLSLLIGILLLLSAFLRMSIKAKLLIEKTLKKNIAFYHLIMGVVHGATNLGGAFLSVLASVYFKEKKEILYIIAFYYLVFSVVQIIVLIFLVDNFLIFRVSIPLSFLAGFICMVLGNRVFLGISNPFYYNLFTLFIGIYGLVILKKSYLSFL